MTPRTREQFLEEMAEAKRLLEDAGREVHPEDTIQEADGLRCDFDLPYSSLPRISQSRWQ